MKIVKYFFTLLFSVSAFPALFSQGIGIGQWRDHLPYNNCIAVAKVDNTVYCATPYSLFYYNISDNSIQTLNKINGLSDFGISAMKYNHESDFLLIAYTNANIDLLHQGQIINMPEIKRASILGNKVVHNIYFLGNLAYISCGFGIVVMDLEKQEVRDTYYIGPNGSQIEVFDFTSNDTSFFAATEQGLYHADKGNPNLANFAAWEKIESPGANAMCKQVEYVSPHLMVNIHYTLSDTDTLYLYDGNNWNILDPGIQEGIININTFNDYIAISLLFKAMIYDLNFNLLYEINVVTDHVNPAQYINIMPNDISIDNNNFVWVADKRSGLVKVSEWTVAGESIMPVGPPSINVFYMAHAGNDIWVAPGGKNDVWGPLWNSQGLFQFHDESWIVYKAYSTPELTGIHDFITLAVDPFDPAHVFAGAFRNDSSLFEFRNNELVNLYDDENSSLQLWPAAAAIAVTGLAFDSYGNLWVANSGAEKILSVRKENGTPDGQWKAYNLGSAYSGIDIGSVLVDKRNYKWILKRKTIENSTFIIVFNDNNTLEDTSDDVIKGLTNNEGSGNTPGNKLFCLAEDLDGEIWIGSDDGISVIYTPENIFEGGNYDAQRIIIPRNDGSGLGDILLENEFISCITVDGDNNKWIGTDGAGVFCLSEDGMTEIYHFTEDNSPLLSDLVTSIAISNNGEVFIGTSKGIISFKSEASTPNEEFNDVYAYPNPVREGYTGSIGIKGLIKDANVKITDISGNLIYETRSLGGQAVWNGKNLQGRQARTGVYLVFITNEDGSQTIVTKILFVK